MLEWNTGEKSLCTVIQYMSSMYDVLVSHYSTTVYSTLLLAKRCLSALVSRNWETGLHYSSTGIENF